MLRTPQCPEGREVVLIANDITYQIGSFGPQEDQLFQVGRALTSHDIPHQSCDSTVLYVYARVGAYMYQPQDRTLLVGGAVMH